MLRVLLRCFPAKSDRRTVWILSFLYVSLLFSGGCCELYGAAVIVLVVVAAVAVVVVVVEALL